MLTLSFLIYYVQALNICLFLTPESRVFILDQNYHYREWLITLLTLRSWNAKQNLSLWSAICLNLLTWPHLYSADLTTVVILLIFPLLPFPLPQIFSFSSPLTQWTIVPLHPPSNSFDTILCSLQDISALHIIRLGRFPQLLSLISMEIVVLLRTFTYSFLILRTSYFKSWIPRTVQTRVPEWFNRAPDRAVRM